VLATADVKIQQVQVVNKTGEVLAVVVWQCGPDIMFSETMDGLFDAARRYRAPKWLVDQLDQLPPSKRFDYRGIPFGGSERAERGIIEVARTPPEGMEDGGDDDIPGAAPA